MQLIHNRCCYATSRWLHSSRHLPLMPSGKRIGHEPLLGGELAHQKRRPFGPPRGRDLAAHGSLVSNPLRQTKPRSVVAEPHPVPERPITVLVAEDEDVLRRLVIRLLGNEGYRILEARDGGEALHLAHLASPHLSLVVTDVVMPGIDGWELGRRLAIDCPAVPVLYMSAYAPADIFHRGAPSPSVPFLEKPFAPEVFLTTVRELLERRVGG